MSKLIRIVPEIRNSVVETMSPSDEILYFRSKADFDTALLASSSTVRRFTWRGLIRSIIDVEACTIEVSEPMWIRYWPRSLLILTVCQVSRIAMRRKPLPVGTYVLENMDYRERFTVPQLDSLPSLNRILATAIRSLVAPTTRIISYFAFATLGAEENYEIAFPKTLDSARARVRFTAVPAQCERCRPMIPVSSRPLRMTFLGSDEPRKGLEILLRAWVLSGLAERSWTLVVMSVQDLRIDVRGVEVRSGSSRQAVHDLLKSSRSVVLPSIRVPRWREQIGLPVIEGIAHGCSVVLSSESGIANELEGRQGVWVVEPKSVTDLAEALVAASTSDGIDASGLHGDWSNERVSRWFLNPMM